MPGAVAAGFADLARRLPDPALLPRLDQRLREMREAMPNLLSLRQIAALDRYHLEALCRAQAQPLYLGDHTAVCRCLSRYKLLLDTRDRGFAAHVLLDGYWEMWLTIFMCRRVQPGMVVVDVGANFGYYTLLLADLVGPQGHAFAIEPNPAATGLLRQSVALNGFAGRTSLVEAAAGRSRAARVFLYAPHSEFKNACIVESPDRVSAAAGTLQQVPQVTIDDVTATSARVDFLKIDAEGAEESIIDGMQKCLSRHKPSLILEFNAARYKNPRGFIKKLTDVYRKIFYLDFRSKVVPVSEDELVSQRHGEDWLLFLDGDTAVRNPDNSE